MLAAHNQRKKHKTTKPQNTTCNRRARKKKKPKAMLVLQWMVLLLLRLSKRLCKVPNARLEPNHVLHATPLVARAAGGKDVLTVPACGWMAWARVGVRVMRGLLNCAKAALFITSSQTPSQPLGGGKPQYRGRWCVCKRSRQRGRAPLSHVPIQRLALEALHPQEARQCLKNGRETAAVYLAMQPCTWSPPQAHTQRAHNTHKTHTHKTQNAKQACAHKHCWSRTLHHG